MEIKVQCNCGARYKVEVEPVHGRMPTHDPSRFHHIIALSDLSGANPETSALLLAAGLSIDIVFKERN